MRRLKPIRGKAAATGRQLSLGGEREAAGAGAPDSGCAALAEHELAPTLEPAPAESGAQQHILNGGTLVPSPGSLLGSGALGS